MSSQSPPTFAYAALVNNVYRSSVLKPTMPTSLVLGLACGAQLMVVLDGLIVSVALPQMRVGLGLSAADQQWIVAGYLVAMGGLLLLAARIADLAGHRRVFMTGLVVFTVASLVGGVAPSGAVLIGARLVQGAGAAVLAPSSLSLLTVTHTGEQRAKALAIWSAASASAGALGLVLGGIITSWWGWRWVLLVNVPVGVVLWVLAALVLAPEPAQGRQRIDVLGAITITGAVGSLIFAISRAQSGWGAVTIVSAAVAVLLLVAFVLIERRVAVPLIPLGIFRHRSLVVGNLTIAALGAVMTATVYFLSLYQQRILGFSPLRTGLALIPMSVVLTVGALASKSLLHRYGAPRLVVTGSVMMAAGLAWLATISPHSHYLSGLLGPTLVWGLGASILTMPCVALATSDVGPEQAGLASGLVNTARQIGGAVGLTILAGIAVAVAAGHDSAASDAAASTVHGYSAAFATSAAIALLIAAGTWFGSRRPARPPHPAA